MGDLVGEVSLETLNFVKFQNSCLIFLQNFVLSGLLCHLIYIMDRMEEIGPKPDLTISHTSSKKLANIKVKRRAGSVPNLAKEKKINKESLKKRKSIWKKNGDVLEKETQATPSLQKGPGFNPKISLENKNAPRKEVQAVPVFRKRKPLGLSLEILRPNSNTAGENFIFPEDSGLAELNDVFRENPKFLTMLVSAWNPQLEFEKVRTAFNAVSAEDMRVNIESDKFKPEHAMKILLEFLCSSHMDGKFWKDVSQRNNANYRKHEFQALPRGIGQFLYLLGQKASQIAQKTSDPQFEAFFNALKNKCEKDKDQGTLNKSLGRISEICKVSLNGEPGFFKKCFDIGQKRGNFVPEQIFNRGHFHFKNALIAERNIFSRKLAEELGWENLCVQTELGCLGEEVGIFSKEAPGKTLANYFPIEKGKPAASSVPNVNSCSGYKNPRGVSLKFETDTESYERLSHVSDEIKLKIVNQALCLEALNIISGEMDPNCGNLNLDIDEENDTAQLTVFDRDYSFGDNNEYLSGGFRGDLFRFSSQEVFDAVNKFDPDKFGEQMQDAGFPNSQIEAMKGRRKFFKEHLEKLKREGKIFDSGGMKNLITSNFMEATGKSLLQEKCSEFNQTLSWEIKLLDALKNRGKRTLTFR